MGFEDRWRDAEEVADMPDKRAKRRSTYHKQREHREFHTHLHVLRYSSLPLPSNEIPIFSKHHIGATAKLDSVPTISSTLSGTASSPSASIPPVPARASLSWIRRRTTPCRRRTRMADFQPSPEPAREGGEVGGGGRREGRPEVMRVAAATFS